MSSSNRTYDIQLLQIMGLFEKATGARLKDALYFKDILTFIVEAGELPRALGRNNSNLERLEKMLQRKVKITEYNTDAIAFVRNLLFPYRTLKIEQDGTIIVIHGPDTKTKGLIIGSKAQNLRAYEGIVQRYFPEVTELKVV